MAESKVGAGSDLANSKTFYLNVWQTLRSIEDETRNSGYGAWARLNEGIDGEYGPSNTFVGTPADVFLVAFTVFEELVQSQVGDEPIAEHEDIVLSSLAICLRQALTVDSPKCTNLMATLADASRLPRWQKPFGTAAQRPYKHGAMPKTEQPQDSILLTALCCLSGITLPTTEDVLRDALCLINNCCQDDDRNRELVLNKNGVSRILDLAYRRIEPDLVVPTLYNICVDNEPATEQLVRWTAGDPTTRASSDPEDDFREASPSESVLQVLLRLADALLHEERKPLLADLLELASRSVTEDLDRLHVEYSGDGSRGDGRTDLLTQLITGPGSRLAAFDTECRLAVCNTLANLFSHEVFTKTLIAAGLVRSFLGIAYLDPSESSQVDPGLDEDSEAEANLLQCRRSVLKTLYIICARPEFPTAYPLNTKLVKDCVTSVRNAHLANTKYDTKYSGKLPFLSSACVILTSLTRSEQAARSLVEEYMVHERLSELLQNVDDPDILYPAINLVGRLALPAPNKSTLLECGLLGAMRRFFANDVTPMVQREAAIAVRRLITGSPQTLAVMRAGNPVRMTDQAAPDNPLAAALALFLRTDDASLKLEIGRLAIEICRLLWASADGRPAAAEHDFDALVVPCKPAFAETIAFVILHGEHPGARGEGWFGLAMMSIWAVGRDLISNCLNAQDMRAEVRNVVASGGGPSYQNLRLVLAKMNAVPKDAFSPETQVVLDSAADEMGLGGIWSR